MYLDFLFVPRSLLNFLPSYLLLACCQTHENSQTDKPANTHTRRQSPSNTLFSRDQKCLATFYCTEIQLSPKKVAVASHVTRNLHMLGREFGSHSMHGKNTQRYEAMLSTFGLTQQERDGGGQCFGDRYHSQCLPCPAGFQHVQR